MTAPTGTYVNGERGVLTGEVLTVNSTCAVYTRTHVLACTYFQAPKVPQDLVCFSVRGACIYLRLGKRVHLTNAVMPALKNTTLDGQNREQVSGTLVLELRRWSKGRETIERESHITTMTDVYQLFLQTEREDPNGIKTYSSPRSVGTQNTFVWRKQWRVWGKFPSDKLAKLYRESFCPHTT